MAYPTASLSEGLGWSQRVRTVHQLDATENLESLRARFGKHVRALIAMPNLEPGRGYEKPSGFVLTLDPKTPMQADVFDLYTLYKGRVILPLLPNRTRLTEAQSEMIEQVLPKISGAKLLDIFNAARAEAIRLAQQAADASEGQASPVPYLIASQGNEIEPSCTILSKSFHEDLPCIMVEDHCSVVYGNARDVVMKPIEDLVRTLVERNGTVSDFFSSSLMLRYLDTMRRYRSFVVHAVRDRLLREIFGTDKKTVDMLSNLLRYPDGEETGEVDAYELMMDDASTALFTRSTPTFSRGEVHQTTNVALDESLDDSLVFYSNALSAVSPGGALISGGPFGGSLWINRRGNYKVVELRNAGKRGAVPYEMPTSVRSTEAREIIVQSMTNSGSSEYMSDVVHALTASSALDNDEERATSQASAPVMWVDESGRVERLRGGVATLAIPTKNMGFYNVVPDLLKTYRLGIDNFAARSLLKQEFGLVWNTEVTEVFRPHKTVIACGSNEMQAHQLWKIIMGKMDHEAASASL